MPKKSASGEALKARPWGHIRPERKVSSALSRKPSAFSSYLAVPPFGQSLGVEGLRPNQIPLAHPWGHDGPRAAT